MRNRWLVCYDICEPRRLRQVYKILRGYGDWMQFSVFRCELSEREQVVLKGLLSEVVKLDEDQVMFVDLGPSEGRGLEAIETLGKPVPEKSRIVVA